MRFCRFEESLDVFDRVVFFQAFAEYGPPEPFFAQYVVLRINQYNGGVVSADVHRALLARVSTSRSSVLRTVSAASGLRP
jgi:hypothetical protein